MSLRRMRRNHPELASASRASDASRWMEATSWRLVQGPGTPQHWQRVTLSDSRWRGDRVRELPPLSYNPHPRLAGCMSSESALVIEAFFHATRAARKRGARIDQSSRLFLAMRDRTIREQRARQLEQDADRWDWEGLWE